MLDLVRICGHRCSTDGIECGMYNKVHGCWTAVLSCKLNQLVRHGHAPSCKMTTCTSATWAVPGIPMINQHSIQSAPCSMSEMLACAHRYHTNNLSHTKTSTYLMCSIQTFPCLITHSHIAHLHWPAGKLQGVTNV